MSLLKTALRWLFTLAIITPLLGGSSLPPGDRVERVRAFIRDIEFDYVSWTLLALSTKLDQLALGATQYLPATTREQMVLDYLDLVGHIQALEGSLDRIYTDPNEPDPVSASTQLRAELAELYAERDRLQPLIEAVLQNQLNDVLIGLDLTLGGQAIPPVLYHTTPTPLALIVSPRDTIRQDANLSITPDLTVDQRLDLEARIDTSLDVSSLVVPVGGIGLYPTMIMQTSDLNWLTEVVAHEWAHNFFTLRPLGINYLQSPELRTMNESAANIAGKEIGRALIERFYPERLPPPPPQPDPSAQTPADENPEPPAFDFRAEMRTTRLKVDELLADGKVTEAEDYMETRRRFFWDHGYRIRKLNQAYFAFHGAYADEPGGAAGDDPIGDAVRKLRAQSPTLSAFLKNIAWMDSAEELFAATNGG